MSSDASVKGNQLVSLAMYVDPPAVRDATRRLWAHLAESLRAAGLAGVPDAPDETVAHDAAWLAPNLLLAQTCGYPFARWLRGQVRLVATPCYNHPGCVGVLSGSFVVVRTDERAASIADLRGRRAAINDRASNSGYNLLRATVAPHARGGRFFAEVVETGGHAASLAAIAAGAADVATIDCVTWGNIQRHEPKRLEPFRILCETAKAPGLPLITRGGASDADVAALRIALDRAVVDPAMAETCHSLGLIDFAVPTQDDYDAVLRHERDAIGLGFPVIA